MVFYIFLLSQFISNLAFFYFSPWSRLKLFLSPTIVASPLMTTLKYIGWQRKFEGRMVNWQRYRMCRWRARDEWLVPMSLCEPCKNGLGLCCLSQLIGFADWSMFLIQARRKMVYVHVLEVRRSHLIDNMNRERESEPSSLTLIRWTLRHSLSSVVFLTRHACLSSQQRSYQWTYKDSCSTVSVVLLHCHFASLHHG